MIVITRCRTRRHFLNGLLTAGAGALFTPGVFAQQLVVTPSQGRGPFYPTPLPLDTDNDLIIVNDGITPAVGTITHLSGRVLDERGASVSNAIVEIWQVDGRGVYLHLKSSNAERRDANFQGFGRFLTGSRGEYYFRTVKPVPYPGRTPHIHFSVKQNGRERLTTQCYVRDEPGNARDSQFNRIGNARERESVLVNFRPVRQSTIAELEARFDIVLGRTPEA